MSSPSAPPPQRPAHSAGLRLAYVPGTTPAKWARIWAQRRPEATLELRQVPSVDASNVVRDGSVDVALIRLPSDTTELAVIRLYDEAVVVVVPAEHVLTAADEVSADDIRGEITLIPADDVVIWPDRPGDVSAHRPDDTESAIELVAAGVGVVIAPQSLARLYHRKDVAYRPISDAPVAPVALAFRSDVDSEPVDEFVGIVRGRKASSSRGQSEPSPKRTAREKTLAKQAARAASGKAGKQAKAGGKPGRSSSARRGRR